MKAAHLAVLATMLVLAASAAVRPGSADAQVSPEEAAQVLLDVAVDFAADGRSEIARAIYELILRRYSRTAAAEEARRRIVAIGPAAETPTAEAVPPPGDVAVGDGRTELIVWTTTYGLFLGVAIPTAFGASDSAPYGVGLLLGGPGGYLAGRSLANNRTITDGQARAITLGGTWGTWQGAGWRDVFDIGEGQVCPPQAFGPQFCGPEDTDEETFAAMVVGGLAGIAVGSVLSHKDITPGTATAANFGSLWGTWFGLASGVLLDLEGDGLLAITLLGGDAGLLYAAIMAPRWNVTRDRARVVSIAGVIGLAAGAALNLIGDTDNEKVVAGISLATSVMGLAFGAAGTSERAAGTGGEDGPPSDGALVSVRGGRWSFDMPVPVPMMIERPGPRGLERRPGLGFTLFRATF